MKRDWKEFDKEKNLFKTVYCLDCKQVKTCRKVSLEYCCSCAYQLELEKAQEYSNYQQVYQQEKQARRKHIKQLQLLKNYQGCKECGGKEVDAYELYENNRSICQPCLTRKTGGSSSPISFSEQSKWYKRFWKIDLGEWLKNFPQLPVNKKCADKWLKDKEHLKNCACLEQEAKELYLLFANSLQKTKERLKECKCKRSEKVRVDYLDSAGSGWTYCEKCEARIESAGHHGVIKNRHSPSFWGLEIKEKILCGSCLEKNKENMPSLRKAEFNRYWKVGRL